MIKKIAELTNLPSKELHYKLDCLKEMDCLEFVEQLIEQSNKLGYDVGYEDGFDAGEKASA